MRFELTRPHILTLDRLPQLVPAGTVIDSDNVEFSPTPAMRPFDKAAHKALEAVCNAIRGAGHARLDCPGFGHLGHHPGGEFAAPFPED